MLCDMAESNRKKKYSSFLARIQPMKSHRLLVYYSPPNFLFSCIRVLLPLPCWDLHRAHHNCRLQSVILCWCQINPFLLEKYLAVYLSQHFGGPYRDPEKTPDGSGADEQTGTRFITQPNFTHCFSHWRVWRYIFLLDLSSCPLWVWSSTGFIQDLNKGLKVLFF